jgi:hypothetical protein
MLGKWTPKNVLIVAGVAAVGAWYLSRTAKGAIKDAGQAINPVNRDNVFYSGVNSVGEAISGDKNFTLGGWLYDLTHSEGAP